MLYQKTSKISLRVPHEYKMIQSAEENTLSRHVNGRVTFHHMAGSRGDGAFTEVFLIRVARLGRNEFNTHRQSSTGPLGFLGFKSRQDLQNFKSAETISKVALDSVLDTVDGTCSSSNSFKLLVPSNLPPTTVTANAQIQYAIVAQTTLPDGTTVLAGSPLLISTQSLMPFQLHTSPLTTFPESTVSMQVTFAKQSSGSKSIPATVHLGGLEVPAGTNLTSTLGVSWVRDTEIRWMAPRQVRWEIEEVKTTVQGQSQTPGVDSVPTSSSIRSCSRQIISKGKCQPTVQFAFNKPTHAPRDVDLQFPLDIEIPDHVDIACAPELHIEGNSISNTVAYADDLSRFAICVEYRLRLYVEMGEDTFDKKSGNLVHRKAAQSMYATSFDLKRQGNNSERYLCGLDLVPPTYDDAIGHK